MATSRTTSSAAGSADASHSSSNSVQLSGRVAAPPEQRVLPSGDTLLTFRLIVDRDVAPAHANAAGRSPSVDTFDCVAWKPALQRRLQTLQAAETVSVEGRLRRRFWRAAGAAASRVEVEVDALRRVRGGGRDG